MYVDEKKLEGKKNASSDVKLDDIWSQQPAVFEVPVM